MTEKAAFPYALDTPVPVIYTDTLLKARAFKDEAGKEKGEPKFGATFLFTPDHPDWKPLKAMAAAAARDFRPNCDLQEVKWPWSNGDKDAAKAAEAVAAGEKGAKPKDYLKGYFVLRSRSKFELTLGYLDENERAVELNTEMAKMAAKGRFYDGVRCLALWNFKAYKRDDGAVGVTAYLNMVLSTAKGEPIKVGNAKGVGDVFTKYSGRASQVDPGSSELDNI